MRRMASVVSGALLSTTLIAASGQLPASVAVGRPSDRIEDLLVEYRGGDADRAVAAFARWTELQVEQHSALPETMRDTWSRAALALLHIEAGRLAATLGGPRSDLRVLTGARAELEPHKRFAHELVLAVSTEAAKTHEARLVEFCRLWQMTVNIPGVEGISDPARTSLLRGKYGEFWMGPEITGGPSEISINDGSVPAASSHGRFSSSKFGDAEKAYRQALSSDPHLPEARLRLGRILYLLDRRPDAAQELARALDDATSRGDVFSGYLAGLFLGRLREDAGQADAAVAAYRAALKHYPSGQTASISIGRLLAVSGRTAEGWAVVRAMLDAEPTARGEPQDPWYAYPPLEQEPWETTQHIAQMRALLRK